MKKDGPPRDVLIVPAIMIGAGGLAFVALEALLRTVWKELPWWDVRAISVGVGLIPAWMITRACFGQKHTYDAGIYKKNPGCLIPAWLFFWSVITIFTSIVLGAPAAAFAYGLIKAVRNEHWVFAPGMLAAGLFALPISVSALSRGLLIWSTRRHVQELATSTARAAAAGLVEIRGVARALDGKDGLIFGQTPDASRPAVPFYVEDASGRIRVEPPPSEAWDEPSFSLALHAMYGLPCLHAGDPILVIGAVRETPAGERVVAPWTPSSAFFGTRILSRPEVFLVCGGGEEAAKRRLGQARLGWLALGTALTFGSLVMILTAAAAWAGAAPIRSLALYAR